MTELQVIARYKISAGKQSQVTPLLARLTEASRGEPGNISFGAYHRLDEDRDVVLLERYASRDAFTANRESTHFKDLVLEQIAPCLDNRVVESYDVLD